jgi:hypothetical protein
MRLALAICISIVACMVSGVQNKPCRWQGGCFITSGSRSLSSWMNNRQILFIKQGFFISMLHFFSRQSSGSAVEVLVFFFTAAAFSLLRTLTFSSGGRGSLFSLLYRHIPSFTPDNLRFWR